MQIGLEMSINQLCKTKPIIKLNEITLELVNQIV